MQFLQPAAPRIHSALCQYTLTSQSCLKLTLLLFCHIYIKTQLEFFSLSLCSSWLTNEVKKLQFKYLSFFFPVIFPITSPLPRPLDIFPRHLRQNQMHSVTCLLPESCVLFFEFAHTADDERVSHSKKQARLVAEGRGETFPGTEFYIMYAPHLCTLTAP